MKAEVIDNHSSFSKATKQFKFMTGTCKWYPTLHFSIIVLPDWITILMKNWLPFPIKPSALPAHPVIENSCSKPSEFCL